MSDRFAVEGLDPAGGTPGQVPKINPDGTAVEYGDPGGGVQSIVPGLNISVDNADPANPVVSASVAGGGGSGSESFADVINSLASSGRLVHYWPLTDGAGSTAADAIGGLHLALTGSYSWMTSPLGGGLSFAGGYGESAGLGSLPVGTAKRCMFVVFRNPTYTNQALMGYGGTSAGNNAGIEVDYNIYRPNIGRFRALASSGRGAWFASNSLPDGHNRHSTNEWKFAALSKDTDNTNDINLFFLDGVQSGDYSTVTVSAGGNFRLGDNPGGSAPCGMDIACAGAFNTYPGKPVVDRLYAAFSRAV